MTGMGFGETRRPMWWTKLAAVRAELQDNIRSPSPAEGILATCRLSDEIRAFALAVLQAQHPHLSSAEIEQVYADRRAAWTGQRQRLSIHDRRAL